MVKVVLNREQPLCLLVQRQEARQRLQRPVSPWTNVTHQELQVANGRLSRQVPNGNRSKRVK